MAQDRDSWRHWFRMETLAQDRDTGSGQRQLETFAQYRDSWIHLPRREKAGESGSGQR